MTGKKTKLHLLAMPLLEWIEKQVVLPHCAASPAGEQRAASWMLKDEIVINAPRAVVYAALNDPEILEDFILRCEEPVKASDTEQEAEAVLKIGQ